MAFGVKLQCPLCEDENFEHDRFHSALAMTHEMILAVCEKIVDNAAEKCKEENGHYPDKEERDRVLVDTVQGIVRMETYVFYCPNKGYILIDAETC